MKTIKTINLKNHSNYCAELIKLLDWRHNLESFEASTELEFGQDYLHMLSVDTISYKNLKKVDEFVQHYHYGKNMNSPLEEGDKIVKCISIAILYHLKNRIKGAIVEKCNDQVELKTPFFDIENMLSTLQTEDDILQVMLNGDSIADYYLKLLEFHSINLRVKTLNSVEGIDRITELTENANQRFDGIAINNGKFTRDTLVIMEDFITIPLTNVDEESKEMLEEELGAFLGSYIINKFGGEWIYFNEQWVVLIHETILCYPFSIMDKCFVESNTNFILKEFWKIESWTSSF